MDSKRYDLSSPLLIRGVAKGVNESPNPLYLVNLRQDCIFGRNDKCFSDHMSCQRADK